MKSALRFFRSQPTSMAMYSAAACSFIAFGDAVVVDCIHRPSRSYGFGCSALQGVRPQERPPVATEGRLVSVSSLIAYPELAFPYHNILWLVSTVPPYGVLHQGDSTVSRVLCTGWARPRTGFSTRRE